MLRKDISNYVTLRILFVMLYLREQSFTNRFDLILYFSTFVENIIMKFYDDFRYK